MHFKPMDLILVSGIVELTNYMLINYTSNNIPLQTCMKNNAFQADRKGYYSQRKNFVPVKFEMALLNIMRRKENSDLPVGSPGLG